MVRSHCRPHSFSLTVIRNLVFVTGNKGKAQEAQAILGFPLKIVSTEERGKRHFGWDPVFIPKGENRTFAQMSPEEKNAKSHRRAALAKFKNYLETING